MASDTYVSQKLVKAIGGSASGLTVEEVLEYISKGEESPVRALQVYGCVRKLEKSGYVKYTMDLRKKKCVYKLTRKGRKETEPKQQPSAPAAQGS